ncbi:hypothetical protein BDV93DRAFT_309359 [Ceratobasidium sp. AG-I]|nr:hypothetical protein BDV93DRAFT_309359 [Ceratobasidium sp. AG-I]
MIPFTDYHCNTLEGLRITYTGGERNQVWEDTLPRFTSLHFLSLGEEDPDVVPLEKIKSQYLRHFEFSLGSYHDAETLSRICKFFSEHCSMLRAITYYHHEPLLSIHSLAERTKSLDIIWVSQGGFSPFQVLFPYAIPYTCWEDTVSPGRPFDPVVIRQS